MLPMCPGYDCSAAAALSCLHVFALQSKGAFDVRWCRGGIAERIFNPWAKQLVESGNVEIRGGARVTSIEKTSRDNDYRTTDEGMEKGAKKEPHKFRVTLNSGDEAVDCDAVIMAVGGTAMSNIAASSSALRDLPIARTFDKLRGVTCVAVRLFLKPNAVTTAGLLGGMHPKTALPPRAAEAMRDSPIFVCGPGVGSIPELEETGFCIYDLQRLHDEFAVDSDSADPVAVLEVDFFRADAISDSTDDDFEVAEFALRAAGAALGCGPDLEGAEIVDYAVVRARNAVSHFAVNSASYSPDVRAGTRSGSESGSGSGGGTSAYEEGIYMCGDWIDRTGHASWSTEKAVVTGRQAAAAVAEDLGLGKCDTEVIPAAGDTVQLTALRQAAKILRDVVPPPDGIPPSPWAFLRDVVLRRNSGKK